MSRRSSDGRQKTRKFPRLRRIVLFAALLCTHAFALASMKDDVEAALEQRWFTVEMIVFQRLQGGTSGGEDLMLSDPRSWPAELEDRAPQTPTELWIDDPELCFGLSPVREASAWMSQGHTMDAIDAYFRPEIESRPELAEPQLDAAQVPPIEGEASQAATPQEDTAAALLADFNTRIAELAARLQAGSYKLRDDYGLQQQYLALRYSRNYRPVLHQRWSQPVPPRSAPAPLLIERPLDDGQYLQGHVAVTVGRYLHFAPHLWLVLPEESPDPQAPIVDAEADTPSATPIENGVAVADFSFSDGEVPEAESEAPKIRYYELSESRRMRSTELHYLDHPNFGVLVRIDPLEIPPEVESAWQALEAFEKAR